MDYSMPDSSVLHCLWVCSDSCPLSQWCDLTVSCSATRFSFCLQSFQASGSFPVSWLFTSGGQNIGVSATALAMNIQGSFPLGLTGLISLQSKGLSRVFSSTIIQNHQFFWCLAFFMIHLTRPYVTAGKTIALTIWIFVGKVMSLLFNILSWLLQVSFQETSVSYFLGCSRHL